MSISLAVLARPIDTHEIRQEQYHLQCYTMEATSLQMIPCTNVQAATKLFEAAIAHLGLLMLGCSFTELFVEPAGRGICPTSYITSPVCYGLASHMTYIDCSG